MGKNKNVLKRAFQDPDILFMVITLFQALTFINTIVKYINGKSTLLEVFLDLIVLVVVVGVFFIFFKQIRKLAEQLESKQLPVSFAIGIRTEEAHGNFEDLKRAVSELTGFSSFDQIDRFNTHAHLLMPLEREYLPPDPLLWKKYITKSIEDIRSFSNGLSGSLFYHIALNCPASMAISLGTVFGTKHRLVCYQHDGDNYIPVLNLMQNQRWIKEHLPQDYQYKYFNISYPEEYTSDIAVIINAASHIPVSDVNRYLQEKGIDACIIEAKNMYSGNLTEKDWVLPVRELFSIFNKIATKDIKNNVHLFCAMPVALGFGLGMALGQFKPIALYNWEKDKATYFPVIKLNEIGISF